MRNAKQVPHDDSVGSLQIKTKSTGPGGQDEDHVLRIWSVEHLDVAGTLLGFRTTIQPEILPTHHFQEVFHNVHDLRHLEENQNPVPGREEFREDTRQKFHLSGGTNEGVVDVASGVHLVLDTVKQEGMLANLSQLHQLVAQAFDATRFPNTTISSRKIKAEGSVTHPPLSLPSAIILYFFICL